ncbi:RNA/RNP complex-1-interacting phosphatase [Echinococcus granulosus]|uniref:RNA/RNP complex-1-interacting phosphatase n=1 Tax=Echinococcus granulosus TaxID=6210 RepID=W6UCS9_ECHGR|nr:RNA/RNP complex-1-interacting phosphatase [Echinococcus granulosus]EUB59095.1 RNA/RNP complex-1-interacting phosphatase [Echinococcus granulosus]
MPRYPPPGWLDYTPLGTRLRGTSLLPVKLPIPKEYSYYIPTEQWFTDNDLLNYCSDMGRPVVSIIDLTYTNYYDPKIVKDVDDESPGTLPAFRCPFIGGVIAVHCTHGVNRTGYLICRYLVDALGWDPDEAIEEFARARGHPIERENYIEDLRNHQH